MCFIVDWFYSLKCWFLGGHNWRNLRIYKWEHSSANGFATDAPILIDTTVCRNCGEEKDEPRKTKLQNY